MFEESPLRFMDWDEFLALQAWKEAVNWDEHEHPPCYQFTIEDGMTVFTDENIKNNKELDNWMKIHGEQYEKWRNSLPSLS